MARASVTALRPALVCSKIIKFMDLSRARMIEDSLWTSAKFCKPSLRLPISSSNSSLFASSSLISALSFKTSAYLKSRSWYAFPSSVSQKRFFVASPVDSASKRSTSAWRSVFTFAKGSEDARVANERSAELLKRCPSRRSTSTALSRCCCSPVETCFWMPTRASLDFAEACWSKIGGWRPADALSLLLTSRNARSLNSLVPVTFWCKMSKAFAIASNSSARICDRWSHCFARVSQRLVRSVM
mmetsp:Transcript_49403/g.138363  ORF Transcript_49403/g.138363 Transcript_49403/m.138363 type:complete len:243 (+) Transcript_49403:546-1274(+)